MPKQTKQNKSGGRRRRSRAQGSRRPRRSRVRSSRFRRSRRRFFGGNNQGGVTGLESPSSLTQSASVVGQ